jgi:hypothetical protein
VVSVVVHPSEKEIFFLVLFQSLKCQVLVELAVTFACMATFGILENNLRRKA